jgi:hypothetical protein
LIAKTAVELHKPDGSTSSFAEPGLGPALRPKLEHHSTPSSVLKSHLDWYLGLHGTIESRAEHPFNSQAARVGNELVDRDRESGMRRMTRLTNAFSKKWENLKAAYALWFAFYIFCRIHQTLRVTPAMEAGLADHVWTIETLLA